MAAVSMSWLDASAYAPFDRAKGIRLPPTTATRRVLACIGVLLLTWCLLTAGDILARSVAEANAVRPRATKERRSMSDRYQFLMRTSVGQLLAKNLGLPNPVVLERYVEGDPLVNGLLEVGGGGRLVEPVVEALDDVGIAHVKTPWPEAAAPGEPAEQRDKGLVFDATALTSSDRLAELQAFFSPRLRNLKTCPRVVVFGTLPERTGSAPERVTQRALEGFTRSLGKEIGRGGTVQLVYVAPGAEDAIHSTLAFLLSPKSAYVSGQVIRIGAHGAPSAGPVGDWLRPLEGRVALVPGASRGIGEQIARVLHRDGATVVGVDVPQAAEELRSVMKEIGGDHLLLDITAKDAPQRIARHLRE